MDYNFKLMNIEYAKKIKDWRYNGFVKSIYMEPYFENYEKENKKLKGPSDCDGFVALNDDEIIGLFEYYFTTIMRKAHCFSCGMDSIFIKIMALFHIVWI